METRATQQKRSTAAIGWIAACIALCVALAVPLTGVRAGTAVSPESDAARRLVNTMLANEQAASQHKDHYAYMSLERSDRTAGHLWLEKVVETNAGKIRMLRAEDGRPLSPDRIASERGRLAAILSDPASFQKKSQTVKDDEAHARQLLAHLPDAFVFDGVRNEGGYEHIDFKPNPDYSPSSMEQRVIHNMTGSMLIDTKMMRLHQIEGRLPNDVSIGFGLLATIRAGSKFSTTRDRFGEPDFKTTLLDTDINGKALFFKSIAKKEHAEHSDFVRVPDNLSLAQAVAIAEQ